MNQQETIDALAEQNRLLREALEFLNSRVVTMELGGVVERALNLPNISTSILNQRDARVLREAAEWFDNEAAIIPDSGKQTVSAFQLHRLAAEKEKHNG